MPLTPSPGPVWDQRPCQGLRYAHEDRVRPLSMCVNCSRWLYPQPTLQPITPRAEVVGVVPVLRCLDRVEA